MSLFKTVSACWLLLCGAWLMAGELLLHWDFTASDPYLQEDASGAGRSAYLLPSESRPWSSGYPDIVDQGVPGQFDRAVSLQFGAVDGRYQDPIRPRPATMRVVSFEPLALPASWTLSFWLKDDRPADARPAEFVLSELLSIRTQGRLALTSPWFFREDPGSTGLDMGWPSGGGKDQWKPIRVPARWVETQVGGDYRGYGWYKTRFHVPAEFADQSHHLFFAGIDAQAWVYVNGQQVGEQSTEATGLSPGQLWNRPFSIEIEPRHLRADEDNLLVVRVHSQGGIAGIFRPIWFLPGAASRFELDFTELKGERATAGDWEHIALVVSPGQQRLYINGVESATGESGLATENLFYQLEFIQSGRDAFSGLLADVRLYDTAFSPDQLAARFPSLYHPGAAWLAEFEPAMQDLIQAGRLSRERAGKLAKVDRDSLLKIMRTSSDRQSQLDAIWALAMIDGFSDFSALSELLVKLESSDREIVAAVDRKLGQLATHDIFPRLLVERGTLSEPLLKMVLERTADWEIQELAAHGLADLTNLSMVVQGLLNKQRSADRELAGLAARGLLKLYENGAFARLARQLTGPEESAILGEFTLASPDPAIKSYAINRLAELGGEAATAALRAAVATGDWRVRRLAAESLYRMGQETESELLGEVEAWPMWQYDPVRSGDSGLALDSRLYLQWVRRLTPPRRAWPPQQDDRGKLDFDISFSPVAAGGQVFVPSSSTDSVTAYSIEDGRKNWRFHANGPVRLAPAVWRGRVFFTADDGCLYAVDAVSGEELWRFRAGPSDHRLLGNQRIINFWAARGAPVVDRGKVYFAAGIWPLHGIFVYALDAYSGEILWVNDTTSSDYVEVPHGGAYGFGGLAPQGYLAVDDDQLIVAGGRTPPAFFDRHNGAFLEADFRPAKGAGNYAVHAVDGGGMGLRVNPALNSQVEALADLIEGRVFSQIAAHDRLLVTTEEGVLYCFGPEPGSPVDYKLTTRELPPGSGEWSVSVDEILTRIDEPAGYALVLGAGSGGLWRELLRRSQFHVLIVENNPDRVAELRRELVESGFHGQRAAVIEDDPADFAVQPYLFSLLVAENLGQIGIQPETANLAGLLELLRPYGGIAWLGLDQDSEAVFSQAASETAVDQVSLEISDRRLFARRGGPLSGAGQWTHQYHDAANTLLSRDRLVRLPLGVLWFGGPSHDNILPRHTFGPRPQVAGGCQVYLGVETIGARCVYTGRQLWEKKFAGIGHPFTRLDHEESWAAGRYAAMPSMPGATYIGSPFVTLSDSVYLRYLQQVYRLAPRTGEILDTWPIPGRAPSEIYEHEELPEWGHISVIGDYLVLTSEPHLFEDQQLGRSDSYSGTSSRRLVVMNRHNGEVLWQREAAIGFRHKAIAGAGEFLFVIDGLSENAVRHLARRGRIPDRLSRIHKLALADGSGKWSVNSQVFGTYLLYSQEHDVLLESGNADYGGLTDEPVGLVARSGRDGEVMWRRQGFNMPGALRGEMLIPGRPGGAISILTGENWLIEQSLSGQASSWNYRRAYGCNTLNASDNFLLFRTGYAGFFDLEYGSGTGTFSGVRGGCTANMVAADGVMNALDYTRSCRCSYALQVSFAMIHMPDDVNIEAWTVYSGTPPDPAGFGINFGAPGRRVDVSGTGLVWYDHPGTQRRHPSAIIESNGSIDWVAASVAEAPGEILLDGLANADYRVRLHFSELAEVEAGQRIFDVLINGESVLVDLDLVEAAGGRLRGLVYEFPIRVTDHRLVVDFQPSAVAGLAPVVSGLEVAVEKFSE